MPAISSFPEFSAAFFNLLEQPQFGGQTFLDYIARHPSERSGDEASVVDNVLSGPLLSLLGFSEGEQRYNAVKSDQTRPDFAPRVPSVGDCFVIEDKATGLELEDKWRQQLAGYVRANGVSLGLLSNGRSLELWEFGPKTSCLLFALDIAAWLELRRGKKPVPEKWERNLESLFDLLRREAFTSAHSIAAQLAVDAETWRQNAQKLGDDPQVESKLVAGLRELVGALQRDARRQLDFHLDAAGELKRQMLLADDAGTQSAAQLIADRREVLKPFLAMAAHDVQCAEEMDEFLTLYAKDPRELPSQDFFLAHALAIFNARRDKAIKSLDSLPALKEALEKFAEAVLTVHARQTRLRQKARASLAVQEDFSQWIDLVSETMLGDLSLNKTPEEAEDAQRQEFALQAAYVVFIRLLLIRVCEDKGLFPERFLSNGGLQFWQQNIQRYLKFVQGNRYEPLLKMAYDNAANIYAHFFTGRELFNWYHLSESGLLEALVRLARYDFAEVDSDLLGTVYNAYVLRHEKKKQGQYYTPRPIVDFILDEVNWRERAMIGDAKRLLDPACGSGTFLVRAAKRLMDAYRNDKGEITDPRAVLSKVRDKIYGFDLNPFACYLAEVNLLIQVLDAIRALPEDERQTHLERFHIYNVDALAKPGRGLLALGHDSLLAEELDVVERIKGRKDAYATGFSHIVANPPYGAKVSDDYKRGLKREWPQVFRGQPDTYVFFYALSLELLGESGRLGFITPNTFLMGANTDTLRDELLKAGRLERIVDLPQGLWKDAAVDCVLLFLARERDAAKREAQGVEVNLMDLRDELDALTARRWAETLSQPQSEWMSDAEHAMDIRRDDIQKAIEAACVVQKKIKDENGKPVGYGEPQVLRLGDVTDSNPGIDPYATEAEGKVNPYIKKKSDVPDEESEWKPLLDTASVVNRYSLLWSKDKRHIKYGNWLSRPRESRFFEAPKFLVHSLRNRSLKRRLVATYDESAFYHRKTFYNVRLNDENYNLKYLLALFNSALLNFWYAQKFSNASINIVYFEQLPIFPADEPTQSEIAGLVDELLTVHDELNAWRERGYSIKMRVGGPQIGVPLDAVVAELQGEVPALETLDLRDARAAGLYSIPEACQTDVKLSESIRIPSKFPTQITLKFSRLWLEVPDAHARRFLLGLLSLSRFAGRTWSELEGDNTIRVPESPSDFERVWNRVEEQEAQIRAQLERAAALDRQIDERVLDLYKITNPAWRAKILDTAPPEAEDESEEAASQPLAVVDAAG
jgi:type I restriction-modification system DNA methylase subunit